MHVGIEAGGVGAFEFLEELLLVAALADVLADVIGFVQREDDEVVRAAVFADGLRDGGLGFLVPGLAVDDAGDRRDFSTGPAWSSSERPPRMPIQ